MLTLQSLYMTLVLPGFFHKGSVFGKMDKLKVGFRERLINRPSQLGGKFFEILYIFCLILFISD